MTVSDNPLEGGIGTLDATSLDNPDNWNFHDPAQDGEIEEAPDEGIEGDEATAKPAAEDETEAAQDADAKSDQDDDETDVVEEPQDGQPDATEDEPKPETSFVLPTGETVDRDELFAGYMKDADYRQKTSQVAESRKTVEAQAQLLQRQVETLTEFVVGALPPEPDANLAYNDPQSYMAQKAIYEQQVGNLEKLLAMANEPKQVEHEVAGQVSREQLLEENKRLAAAFPMTADVKGRETFFKSAFEAAGNLGFTDDELKGATDSRLFGLAYYAQIGMQAEKAKAKAKQKVASAPKAAPKKQRTSTRSDQAMKRLQKSGSIHDAVMVDFE